MTQDRVYDDNKARRESLHAFIQLTPDFEYAGGFENCASILMMGGDAPGRDIDAILRCQVRTVSAGSGSSNNIFRIL